MRVIAGTAKGRRLATAKGLSIRPSSERVRGAAFSILESAGVDMDRVLDLYAGTGAFGIEALSRGAGWVDFVEQDRGHVEVIKANLRVTGFDKLGEVHRMPVQAALGKLGNSYGVIFLDPPYDDGGVDEVLSGLAGSQLVGDETIIVAEHSRRVPLGQEYGAFALGKTRRYGDTMLSIYHQEVTP